MKDIQYEQLELSKFSEIITLKKCILNRIF